jgi:hypothetical protein
MNATQKSNAPVYGIDGLKRLMLARRERGNYFHSDSVTLSLIKSHAELLASLEQLTNLIDEPPEKNCSCHLSPPCCDCVDYSGLREAFADAKDAIRTAERI